MAAADDLASRHRGVMERVAAAAQKSGRDPSDVLVVAVTKEAQPQDVLRLAGLGHRDFGENRVQHLQEQAQMVQGAGPEADPLRWHMIGHLQRNKVRAVLELVRLIHSVDSLRLAEEIQEQAARLGLDRVDVLLQVNTAGELSKFGLATAAVIPMAEQVMTMSKLRLRGLMTIAPLPENPEEARPCFERSAELFQEMRSSRRFGERFDVLSMGMSNDFELAIGCGANMVRIGRAIFGAH